MVVRDSIGAGAFPVLSDRIACWFLTAKELMNRAFYILLTACVLSLPLPGCNSFSANYEERGDRYFRDGHYDDSLAEYLMAQKTDGLTTRLLRKIGKVYGRIT